MFNKFTCKSEGGVESKFKSRVVTHLWAEIIDEQDWSDWDLL